MKIIVGLGNPGEKYQHNRHNVGFIVVEELNKFMVNETWGMVKKFNAEIIQSKDFILVKPQTFMNESGVAVEAICRFYKIKHSELYIIHDDLDIKLGEYKIQFGRGPKVHNGLSSVNEKLGSDQYWHVRVGVENREIRGNKGVPGVVYSLDDFRTEEKKLVDGVIKSIVEEMKCVVSL